MTGITVRYRTASSRADSGKTESGCSGTGSNSSNVALSFPASTSTGSVSDRKVSAVGSNVDDRVAAPGDDNLTSSSTLRPREKKTLWVGDLDHAFDPESNTVVDEAYILEQMFYEFNGYITQVRVCHRDNRYRRGLSCGGDGDLITFGFVEFSSEKIAGYILHHFNGRFVPGKMHKYKLNWANFNLSDKQNEPTKSEKGNQQSKCDGETNENRNSTTYISKKRFSSGDGSCIMAQPVLRYRRAEGSDVSTKTCDAGQTPSGGRGNGPTGSSQMKEGISIWVGSLDPATTREDLESLFTKHYNSVCHVKVVLDPSTQQCRGFGFVHFLGVEESEKALAEMNGQIIRGRRIRVNRSNSGTGRQQQKNGPNESGSGTNKETESHIGGRWSTSWSRSDQNGGKCAYGGANDTSMSRGSRAGVGCNMTEDSHGGGWSSGVPPSNNFSTSTPSSSNAYDPNLFSAMDKLYRASATVAQEQAVRIGYIKSKRRGGDGEGCRVIVRGIEDKKCLSEALLLRHFSAFGEIVDINMNGADRKKVVVTFVEPQAAQNAVFCLNNSFIGTHKVTVEIVGSGGAESSADDINARQYNHGYGTGGDVSLSSTSGAWNTAPASSTQSLSHSSYYSASQNYQFEKNGGGAQNIDCASVSNQCPKYSCQSNEEMAASEVYSGGGEADYSGGVATSFYASYQDTSAAAAYHTLPSNCNTYDRAGLIEDNEQMLQTIRRQQIQHIKEQEEILNTDSCDRDLLSGVSLTAVPSELLTRTMVDCASKGGIGNGLLRMMSSTSGRGVIDGGVEFDGLDLGCLRSFKRRRAEKMESNRVDDKGVSVEDRELLYASCLAPAPGVNSWHDDAFSEVIVF